MSSSPRSSFPLSLLGRCAAGPLLALLAAFGAPGVAAAETKPGARAAELVGVVDRAGKPITLAAQRGRVVVMTFGASWCEPCKRELPAFEKLAATYAARKARVTFLAINIDGDRVKADGFIKQAGLRAVLAGYDTAKATVETYDPGKMPTTFVIRDGVVRHVHGGYAAGDEKKVAALVDAELAALPR
jgi:thiol-disulfide isomerase/thioredoxin